MTKKLQIAVEESNEIDGLIGEIRAACPSGRIVFLSGNFNVIHPGHLRLLNFAAECGDILVVGVYDDGPRDVLVPAELRLENVRSIGIVDYAFILRVPPEDFIAQLKPEVVVKGKEHELQYNREMAALNAYGGQLLFSSGEVRFSSLDLLRKELQDINLPSFIKPVDYLQRHGFDLQDLIPIIKNFSKVRVVVIGEVIVDEYITCEPVGMSQEDPTLVVTPVKSDRFMGGASSVARHMHGLGAHVEFFTVTGNDSLVAYIHEMFQNSDGLKFELLKDFSRPTILKQRFRAGGKTLLRVNHLRHHDISADFVQTLFSKMVPALDRANLLVFSDFNYGCLPQVLVDMLRQHCFKHGIMMVADSQTSSQVGDVTRFQNMHLLTPTEHEARVSMRDVQSGLATLAEKLRQKASADQIMITLGAEGLLIHTGDSVTGMVTTDRLPAFNSAPKDVNGAGDALFSCAALALASGADVWRSAYLGSIGAALQVSRLGNQPLLAANIISELNS